MKGKFVITGAWLFLLSVYAYLIFGALSYRSAWMHSENVSSFTPTALENSGNSIFNFKDYLRAFDLSRFENSEPRPTRPLSNAFSILNTKLRSHLWKYVPPHPSFNLGTVIALLLIPWALFKLLRAWKFSLASALMFVAFYLASPASISDFSQNFRPSKTMVTLCLIVGLCWGQRLKNKVSSKAEVFFFFIFLLQTLFWDETGWLIFGALLVFNPQLLRQTPLLVTMILAAVFGLAAYFYVFPWIMVKLHYPYAELIRYDHFHNPLQHLLSYKKYLGLNLQLLLADSFGLHFHLPSMSDFWSTLLKINRLLFFAFSLFFILGLGRASRHMRFLVLWLIGLGLFHTYLMTANRWLAHGIFYYANYFSLFFVLVLALFLREMKIPRGATLAFLLLLSPGIIYKAHHFNLFRKETHFHPAFTPEVVLEYLRDHKNRYERSRSFVFYNYAQTKEKWEKILRTKSHFAENRIDENYFSAEIIAQIFPGEPQVLGNLYFMRGMYERLPLTGQAARNF